jgi:L-seryl-tRNA(Ser) seleniumtransferase
VDPHDRLRQLPKVDQVLRRTDVAALPAPRWAVVEAVRREVDRLRKAILDGASDRIEVTAEAIGARAAALVRPSLRRVINATGVVLHTNLGRAPLPAEAIERVVALAAGYSNLEYELGPGRRGSRHAHLGGLLAALTGAEDAVVVNNNAGAVMLSLAALAAGREVVVSRGELVEIGGSFRVPDVMRLSGAELREVGTTNKTRLEDYEQAITERTALLLKVHRSNFAIVGFTEEASAAEVAALGRRRGVATMMDLGSGSLVPAAELAALGLPAEPDVAAVVGSGLDLVTFSGDKLLGGPQAGIVVGRAEAIAAVRAHPLMRALRPDKLSLAALEATVAIYRDGRAGADVPALAMLATPLAVLRGRADELCALIGARVPGVRVDRIACESAVGGGAMPTASLPSWGVALSPAPGGVGVDDLDARLRAAPVPVIGRIADDRLLLDVRTLQGRAEIEQVAAAVRSLASAEESG